MAYTIDQRRYPYPTHEDTVAGTYNGSNVTFTLRNIPSPGTLNIFNASGQRLRETVDYTRSGLTLTATVAPESTDNWIANYETQ